MCVTCTQLTFIRSWIVFVLSDRHYRRYEFKGSPDPETSSQKRDQRRTECDFLLLTFSSARKKHKVIFRCDIGDFDPTSETGSTSYINLDGQKSVKREGLAVFLSFIVFSRLQSLETVFTYFRYRKTPKSEREREEGLFPLKQFPPAPDRRMSAVASFSVKFFCCLPQRPFRSSVRIFRWRGYLYILLQIELKLDHDLYGKMSKPKIQCINL